MPCFSVAVDDGQPAQAPFMLRNTTPFSIAAEGDVAAILGNGGAHPGFQQFLDGDHDLGIGRVVELAVLIGASAAAWLPVAMTGAPGEEVLHDRAEDGRLEMLPVRPSSFVTVTKS